MTFDTPIALFVFNRPETTQRVFAEIAKIRPRRLLIVADGPRESRPGEAERCAEVRRIVEALDWDCDVEHDYAERNLGCRRRVSSGLDWVFARCEEAIILEDDCLPHPTFFRFCADLLELYRDDERVMMVSGDNFQPHPPSSGYSYYFSAYAHIWGWATWRRAWRHYDVAMEAWPSIRDGIFHDLGDGYTEAYWRRIFDRTHGGEIDTWDYQWLFACFAQSGLTIIPEVNLVSNIGFGADATHTREENHISGMHAASLAFPLRHPPLVVRDAGADRVTFERVFEPRPPARRLPERAVSFLRRIIGSAIQT